MSGAVTKYIHTGPVTEPAILMDEWRSDEVHTHTHTYVTAQTPAQAPAAAAAPPKSRGGERAPGGGRAAGHASRSEFTPPDSGTARSTEAF